MEEGHQLVLPEKGNGKTGNNHDLGEAFDIPDKNIEATAYPYNFVSFEDFGKLTAREHFEIQANILKSSHFLGISMLDEEFIDYHLSIIAHHVAEDRIGNPLIVLPPGILSLPQKLRLLDIALGKENVTLAEHLLDVCRFSACYPTPSMTLPYMLTGIRLHDRTLLRKKSLVSVGNCLHTWHMFRWSRRLLSLDDVLMFQYFYRLPISLCGRSTIYRTRGRKLMFPVLNYRPDEGKYELALAKAIEHCSESLLIPSAARTCYCDKD